MKWTDGVRRNSEMLRMALHIQRRMEKEVRRREEFPIGTVNYLNIQEFYNSSNVGRNK